MLLRTLHYFKKKCLQHNKGFNQIRSDKNYKATFLTLLRSCLSATLADMQFMDSLACRAELSFWFSSCNKEFSVSSLSFSFLSLSRSCSIHWGKLEFHNELYQTESLFWQFLGLNLIILHRNSKICQKPKYHRHLWKGFPIYLYVS